MSWYTICHQATLVLFDFSSSIYSLSPNNLTIYSVSCLTQLRVVRAFKSTLEDIEEKRSVHSFHSFHSLRSSRSHHGWQRPLSEELSSPADVQLSIRKMEPNGSYTNMALVMHENNAAERQRRTSNKSRSAENISTTLESTQGGSPTVMTRRPSPKPPSPRTFSTSDINVKLHETAI
jgi:hypothetical protein